MKRARAEIRWRPSEAGGRSELPSSPYTAVAQLEDDEATDQQQWSLVCDLQDGDSVTADVHFLAEKAPHHLLRPGATFALQEGERTIARGKVLERLPVRPQPAPGEE
jgi:hypothetical protein